MGDDADEPRSCTREAGERENGTNELAEAISAYHEALKERTRERVPLDWATTSGQSWNWTFNTRGAADRDENPGRGGRGLSQVAEGKDT